MTRKTIVLSVNASWNIVNFRRPVAEALVGSGYRLVALAPEDEFSERLAALGVEFMPITIDRQGISPRRDLMLLMRYREALKQIGADLFLGYTVKPNVYGSLAAHSLGIPVINNVSGLGTAFIRKGLLPWVVTRLYRLALRRSATVFFQNRDDHDLFLRKRIVRPDQASLLPGSGIDLEHFRPRREHRRSKGPVFLYLGRLLWDKGVREYVEAARLVRARVPDARFRLLGFVDVPNRSAVARADIENWMAEGLVDYIEACDDVRPHIAAADCVVLPSYREGLPRSLLEGAAMAKPLIATDVPGCRDVIEHEVNGYLCTARDAASLASAMLRLTELGDDRRLEMGRQGRMRVEKSFSQELVVERYVEAIERVLAGREGSPDSSPPTSAAGRGSGRARLRARAGAPRGGRRPLARSRPRTRR